MSLYKSDKSPFWQYDFQVRGVRIFGSSGCRSKRDAQQVEDRQRRKAILGEQDKPPITVDEAFGTWWQLHGRHQRHAAVSKSMIPTLTAGLGSRKLVGDVTVRDFDRHIARRRDGRKNGTVNRETQLARRVWRWNAARGFDVPAIDWKALMLSEPNERVRELSEDEEARLWSTLPDSLVPLVTFALLSGQRKAECVGLRWSDVDLGGARATVQVKGGHPHAIPLTPAMVALIASQPKAGPFVFTYVCERTAPTLRGRVARLKGDRYPFSRQGWDRKWRKALEAAGIADFTFHDLRHTRGTRMLRQTGNIKAVQSLFGHADLRTTARYAHALEADVRDAMRAGESRNSPGQIRLTKFSLLAPTS